MLNERGAVEVKSAASQKTLDASIRRMDVTEQFASCHSPKGALCAPDGRPDICVWTGRELGSTVMRRGLRCAIG
ncbi:hypothetical protein ABIA40_004908 [Bradyrhizobium sp. USDA 223]